MTQARAVLAGTGIAVPPLEVDNHMLSRIIETSDDWVRERSGIVTRYYVEPGVGSSDLGAEAARAALADAGVEAGRGRLPGLRHDDARTTTSPAPARSSSRSSGCGRCRRSTSASSAPASPTASRWWTR